MTSFDRLTTELICYANGCNSVEVKSNLAVDNSGELVEEIHIKAVAMLSAKEITIEIGLKLE